MRFRLLGQPLPWATSLISGEPIVRIFSEFSAIDGLDPVMNNRPYFSVFRSQHSEINWSLPTNKRKFNLLPTCLWYQDDTHEMGDGVLRIIVHCLLKVDYVVIPIKTRANVRKMNVLCPKSF